MGKYDLFRKIDKSNLTSTQRIQDQIKSDITNDFQDSPSYLLADIKDLNGTTLSKGVQVVDDNSLKNKTSDSKKILMQPNDVIKAGYEVNFNSNNWICISDDEVIGIYEKGLIQKSNYILKWLNNSGSIIQQPCIIEDYTARTQSLNENKFLVVGDGILNLTVPRNTETLKLIEDKRFLIGNNPLTIKAYKLVKVNDVTFGLIRLVLNQCELSVNDNKTLGIADYNNLPSYIIEILNGTTANIQQTTTLQLNVVVKNSGVIVSPPPTLVYISNNTNCTVNSSGLVTGSLIGSSTISVKLASDLSVVDNIAVTVVTLPVDNFTVDITGVTAIPINQTKNYSCSFKNNGIVYSDTSVWTLKADDGISTTTLASITASDSVLNTCNIKANNSNQYGYVRLYVKNTGDTVSNYIRIQIKSLL